MSALYLERFSVSGVPGVLFPSLVLKTFLAVITELKNLREDTNCIEIKSLTNKFRWDMAEDNRDGYNELCNKLK